MRVACIRTYSMIQSVSQLLEYALEGRMVVEREVHKLIVVINICPIKLLCGCYSRAERYGSADWTLGMADMKMTRQAGTGYDSSVTGAVCKRMIMCVCVCV